MVDWDGDGRLDLLGGDYSSIVRLRALTAEERADFAAVQREERELQHAPPADKEALA